MKPKSFTIKYNPRTKTSIPSFEFKGENMEKYEAIGLMHLAIEHLTNRCNQETAKHFKTD